MWILPIIFVLVHTPNGDQPRSYQGQSQATIQALLAGEGKKGEFVTQARYQAVLDAQQSAQKSAPANLKRETDLKQARKDLNDKTKTVDQRFDALVKVLGLGQ